MFTDPQVVTINAVAQSMPRIEQKGTSSTYQKADQSYSFTISHTQASKNRYRSMVRLDKRSIVPDPLTAVNDYENLGIYLVIDRPLAGFTATEVDQCVQGLKTWLTTAAVTALYGRES